MWPFNRNKIGQMAAQPDWRAIAATTAYNRANYVPFIGNVYRSSVSDIAARAAMCIPLASFGQQVDALVYFFEAEEFSLLEDVSDGSHEAFA